jgi:hypothetical protein
VLPTKQQQNKYSLWQGKGESRIRYQSDEGRFLVHENPVHTSQETHYVSATEPRPLMLRRSEFPTVVTKKNVVLWDVTPCVLVSTDVSEEIIASIIMVTRQRARNIRSN